MSQRGPIHKRVLRKAACTHLVAFIAGILVPISAPTLMSSLKEGTTREWKRTITFMMALGLAIIEDHFWVIMLGCVALIAWFVSWYLLDFRASTFLTGFSLFQRKRTMMTHKISSTDRRLPTQNKVIRTRHATIFEVLLLESWAYFMDPTNMITLIIVVLQGLGSGWTKHKMNMYLYIACYLIHITSEFLSYIRQDMRDRLINGAKYKVIKSHNLKKLSKKQRLAGDGTALKQLVEHVQTVRAEDICLGDLLYLQPGDVFPIDAIVLQGNCLPFNYPVTGENTVFKEIEALGVDPLEVEEVKWQCKDHHPQYNTRFNDPEPAPAPSLQRSMSDTPGSASEGLNSPNYISNSVPDLASLVKQEPNMVERVVASNNLVSRGCVLAALPGAQETQSRWFLAGAPLRFLEDYERQRKREEDGGEDDTQGSASSSSSKTSKWQSLMRRVFILQAIVLLFFSIQGASSGHYLFFGESEGSATSAAINTTSESIIDLSFDLRDVLSLWTFLSFLAGQFVLGNMLLPMREKLLTMSWLQMVKRVVPENYVQRDVVLEDLSKLKNVVSDKTGTLTTEEMQYQTPIRYPHYDQQGGTGLKSSFGPLCLFFNNDSLPNTLYQAETTTSAQSDIPDAAKRLYRSPALCTTGEEGAMFAVLNGIVPPANDPTALGVEGITYWLENRRDPDRRASVPGLLEIAEFVNSQGEETKVASELKGEAPVFGLPPWLQGDGCMSHSLCRQRRFRVVLHHLGDFQPKLVGRLSVVSVYRMDNSANVEQQPLEHWLFRGSFLAAQGGGDAIARWCGPEAAEWEKTQLMKNPSRTFGHALAPLDRLAPEQWLSEEEVMGLYDQCRKQQKFQLAYLSKFDNPPVDGVRDMISQMKRSSVRLHVCSGDTYITLKDVLQKIGMIGGHSTHAGLTDPVLADKQTWLWDEHKLVEVLEDPDRLYSDNELDRLAKTLSPQKSAQGIGNCLVIFVCQKMLEWLHKRHRHDGKVQRILKHPSVALCCYRTSAVKKRLAIELFSHSLVQGPHLPLLPSEGSRGTPLSGSSGESDEDRDEPPQAEDGNFSADEEEEEEAETEAVDIAGFLGDGPNDEPAIQSTPYGLAVSTGCDAARSAAAVVIESACSLPKLWMQSRLYRGGISILLRDVVFMGSFLVVILSIGAHLVKYEPMMENAKLHVVGDPWNPILLSVFTTFFHTPRMFAQAIREGARDEWQDHSFLVWEVILETCGGLLSAVWVGMLLKTSSGGDIVVYGKQALVAVAMMSLLRQNLVIKHSFLRNFWYNLKRLVSGKARRRQETVLQFLPAILCGSGRVGHRISIGALDRNASFLDSFVGQLLLLLSYAAIVSGIAVFPSYLFVAIKACFTPAVLFIVLRSSHALVYGGPQGVHAH